MGVLFTCVLCIMRLASVELSIKIRISSSDLALLLYTSRSRSIVRMMQRVEQPLIANNVTIERRSGHHIEMRTIKRPEFVKLLTDTCIYLDEMSLYNVVASMCMHRRVNGIH